MWALLKKHAPKKLPPHLEFFSKYLPHYSNWQFYWQLTIFQFFTKTRLGYWFYCAAFIFSLVEVTSFFMRLIMAFIVINVLGSAITMAALKGSSKVRAFLEKRAGLNSKIVDNSIKDSPVWIIVSAYKPALIFSFLMILVDATESHRINKLNEFLLALANSDYINKWESSEEKAIAAKVANDMVHMVTTPSGITGAFSKLKDYFIIPDYFYFSFFILIMIVLLLLLEKRRK